MRALCSVRKFWYFNGVMNWNETGICARGTICVLLRCHDDKSWYLIYTIIYCELWQIVCLPLIKFSDETIQGQYINYSNEHWVFLIYYVTHRALWCNQVCCDSDELEAEPVKDKPIRSKKRVKVKVMEAESVEPVSKQRHYDTQSVQE